MKDQATVGPDRVKILSWPVDLFTKKSLLAFLADRVDSDAKTIVANVNLHALYCLERSPAMASLFSRRNTVVHIDGMPIVWLLKLKGVAATGDNRLTYLDWAMEALAMSAKNGWKVGYIGSMREICEAGIVQFTSKFPNLNMRGWDGYFDMEDEAVDSKLNRTLEEVNAFEPDLLIVGMGMPRQEEFLERYSHRLKYRIAICSGAFVEYLTGVQSMPPRLIGKIGLEWFYRLICDPRRYAYRYLAEPLMLVCLIARTRWQADRPRRRT